MKQIADWLEKLGMSEWGWLGVAASDATNRSETRVSPPLSMAGIGLAWTGVPGSIADVPWQKRPALRCKRNCIAVSNNSF
jgi:hypothetical protein